VKNRRQIIDSHGTDVKLLLVVLLGHGIPSLAKSLGSVENANRSSVELYTDL